MVNLLKKYLEFEFSPGHQIFSIYQVTISLYGYGFWLRESAMTLAGFQLLFRIEGQLDHALKELVRDSTGEVS